MNTLHHTLNNKVKLTFFTLSVIVGIVSVFPLVYWFIENLLTIYQSIVNQSFATLY